jgi:hypothetical protein
MLHKISKKQSKHRIMAGISNFFGKCTRKIKTALKVPHAPTGTTAVTVSNQKRSEEEN